MNAALKQMLPAIETWPEEDQQALAEYARELEAARTGLYVLSPDEEVAVAEGLAEADRSFFADDEEMSALFQHYSG